MNTKHRRLRLLLRLLLQFIGATWVVVIISETKDVTPVLATSVVSRAERVKLQLFTQLVHDCEGVFVHETSTVISPQVPIRSLFGMFSAIFVLGRSLHDCEALQIKPNKYICVVGKQMDSCLSNSSFTLSSAHGHLVSLSHAAMLVYAISHKYHSLVLLEADVRFRDISHLGVSEFSYAMSYHRNWNIIRFGYRPFFAESILAGNTLKVDGKFADFMCPKECHCALSPRKSACFMSVSGCDMRSADFYAAHERVYSSLLNMLLSTAEDRVIDWTVLQHVDKQWYAIPSLTIQKTLDIPIEIQLGFQSYFEHTCQV